MRRGFFVPRCAVDLSGQPQSRHSLAFKGGHELYGIGKIVFNGIAGAQHDGVFQAAHRVDHVQLHVQRQAGGNAVGIDLGAVEPFRLKKYLMALPVGKAGHLVLDGRAVARARALDDAREHGRTVKAAADDLVRAFVGPGYVAGHLGQYRAGPVKAERRGRIVALLFLQHRIVDGGVEQPWRGAGFQAAQREAQGTQAV